MKVNLQGTCTGKELISYDCVKFVKYLKKANTKQLSLVLPSFYLNRPDDPRNLIGFSWTFGCIQLIKDS